MPTKFYILVCFVLCSLVSFATDVATFAELKTAFKSGGTITLTDNITHTGSKYLQIQNANITLDLNGHTITSTATTYIFDVNVGATLTIQDSQGTGAILIDAPSVKPIFKLYNTSNLTINGGSFSAEYIFETGSGHTLTINGGTFSARTTIFNQISTGSQSYTLNINGGSFNSTNAIFSVADKGIFNINEPTTFTTDNSQIFSFTKDSHSNCSLTVADSLIYQTSEDTQILPPYTIDTQFPSGRFTTLSTTSSPIDTALVQFLADISAAQHSDTHVVVSPTADLTLPSHIDISQGNLTIDLAGHTLTASDTIFFVSGNCQVSIINGNLISSENALSNSYILIAKDEQTSLSLSNLTLQGNHLISIEESAHIDIDSCTLNAQKYCLELNSASASIYDVVANASSESVFLCLNSSTLNIYGGTYTALAANQNIISFFSTGNTLTLLGTANFFGSSYFYKTANDKSIPTVFIPDSLIYINQTDSTEIIFTNTQRTIPLGSVIMRPTDTDTTVTDTIQPSETTPVDTALVQFLADITVAQHSDTHVVVSLTADLTLPSHIDIQQGNFTIDLAGHTLTASDTILFVSGNSQVSIINGSLTTSNDDSDKVHLLIFGDESEVYIDSCKLSSAGQAISVYDNATVSLSNDTIIGTAGIVANLYATTNLTNVYLNVADVAINTSWESTVNIQGGTYISNLNTINLIGNSKVNISGGSFISNQKNAIYFETQKPVLTILDTCSFTGAENIALKMKSETNLIYDTNLLTYFSSTSTKPIVLSKTSTGSISAYYALSGKFIRQTTSTTLPSLMPDRPNANILYNLSGQPLSSPKRGLNIRNRKLLLVK